MSADRQAALARLVLGLQCAMAFEQMLAVVACEDGIATPAQVRSLLDIPAVVDARRRGAW